MNHDIIIDILVKLPVKSLSRFKGVCKSWFSLIEDSQFIKLHHDTSKSDINRHKIFLACQYLYSRYYSIDASLVHDSVVSCIEPPVVPNINHWTTRVYSSSYNGIILLICPYDVAVLWNPAIRKSRIIPSPKPPLRRKKRSFASYAFGYIASIDDYKIFRVGYKSFRGYYDIEIFSTKRNSWKLMPNLFPSNYRFFDEDIVALGGDIVAVDGIVYMWEELSQDSDLMTIVSFCLEKETLQEVLFPNRIQMREMPVLYAVGDNLCLAKLFCNSSMYGYEVWCMTKNGMGSTWSKILSIRGKDSWRYPHALRPLSFMKNGDLLLLRSPAEFVVYNSKSGELEQVKVDGLEASHDVRCVMRYVETLFSPNS